MRREIMEKTVRIWESKPVFVELENAPSGLVTFVSSLYAGSISDKHITMVSGILDLLESGDQVMADKTS